MGRSNEQTKNSAKYVALRDIAKSLQKEYKHKPNPSKPTPYLPPYLLDKNKSISRLNKELGICGINKVGNNNNQFSKK